MRNSILSLFFVILLFSVTKAQGKFKVKFQWRGLNFNNLPFGTFYNFTHPGPFGVAFHKNRLFIGIPRRNYGVPVTLGFVDINDQGQDPTLRPYPNYFVNSLPVLLPVS